MRAKRLTITFFILLLSFPCLAQEKRTLTAAEEFSSRSGSLIKKEFIDVSKVKGVDISIMVYTDLVTDQSVKALRFETKSGSGYSSETHTAALDVDEIDGLLKSINLLSNEVMSTSPNTYTEVIYRSKSGFSAGSFYSKGKWNVFMRLDKYDRDSNVYLKTNDLALIGDAVKAAQMQIKSMD